MIKFALACIAHCIYMLIIFARLPERVAMHFNAAGLPDSFASKNTAFLLCVGFPIVFGLILIGIARLCQCLPPETLNVPNPGYWRKPENNPTAGKIMAHWMSNFAAWSVLFLSAIFAITLKGQHDSPPKLDGTALVGLVGIFILFTFYQVFRLIQAYKVDDDPPGQAGEDSLIASN